MWTVKRWFFLLFLFLFGLWFLRIKSLCNHLSCLSRYFIQHQEPSRCPRANSAINTTNYIYVTLQQNKSSTPNFYYSFSPTFWNCWYSLTHSTLLTHSSFKIFSLLAHVEKIRKLLLSMLIHNYHMWC